jgi:hypothetical protein
MEVLVSEWIIEELATEDQKEKAYAVLYEKSLNKIFKKYLVPN